MCRRGNESEFLTGVAEDEALALAATKSGRRILSSPRMAAVRKKLDNDGEPAMDLCLERS
jgi:hypothetical protein